MTEAADVAQLVGCISEMLARITRIHEYEVDCLRKENRFLASQAKASLSTKAHHEAQHEHGDSTPEQPSPKSRPMTMVVEVCPEQSHGNAAQQQLQSEAASTESTHQQQQQHDQPCEDGLPPRLSAQELREVQIAARLRVIGDCGQDKEDATEQRKEELAEDLVEGRKEETAEHSAHVDHKTQTRRSAYQLVNETPESSNDEAMLPQTLAEEVEKSPWPEKPTSNVAGLEQLETIGWGSLHLHDNKDQSTVACDSMSVELCSVWKVRRRSLGRLARRALSLQRGHPSLPVVESQSTAGLNRQAPQRHHLKVLKSLHSLWQRMIARPSSHRRLIWDLIGMILIGYDVIAIPLQIFDPPPNLFAWLMAWFCTVYWTFDIPCTVLVGYHTKGVLEMRPLQISKHYGRTWFLFDVGVVAVDWMCTIAEHSDSTGNNRVGFLRFGRLGRFLRMLRLLRLLKLHGMLMDIFERIHSEFVRIMLGIVNVLVFIVLVNHVIACGWYWVGTHSYDAGYPSWVVEAGLGSRTLPYNYTTSVHWSLTQFTPASMEVVPKNTFERSYNVFTLLFAMCTFSSFVSSITNAMTRLRNLNNETVQKATVLRQYLKENRIPGEMSNRIWAWLQNTEDTSSCRIHQDQVAILPTLPALLQTELHHAIYKPLLDKHPFFAKFAGAYSDGMRNLYSCLVEVGMPVGKELFHCGEQADRMWFVFGGRLRYLRDGEQNTHSWEIKELQEVVVKVPSINSDLSLCSQTCTIIGEGEWASEHPLWIHWHHAGQLTALSHCELFAVISQKFQEIMQYELHGVWQAAKYARCFLYYLHSSQVALTDVWADLQVLGQLATRAFTVTDDDVPSSSSGESSNYFSSPRSRPSPLPWDTRRPASSYRHSRPSASTRASRQSQNSLPRESLFSQGSGRKSFGTPSQQVAHPVSRNSVLQAEEPYSDPEMEAALTGWPVRTSVGNKMTTI